MSRQRSELSSVESELAEAREEVVQVREEAILQEIGIYEYQHPLESSVEYKGRLAELRDQIKTLARGGEAVVGSTDWTVNNSVKEGRKLAGIAPNIAVKVPLTMDGLRTCKALSDDGVMVNVTLCFSAAQALLAAKAGASFISPFVGRLDDIQSEHEGAVA